MRYLGGKSRTAQRIVVTITEHAIWHGCPTRWVEPFMGGGSVMVAASRLECSSPYTPRISTLS